VVKKFSRIPLPSGLRWLRQAQPPGCPVIEPVEMTGTSVASVTEPVEVTGFPAPLLYQFCRFFQQFDFFGGFVHKINRAHFTRFGPVLRVVRYRVNYNRSLMEFG